MHGHVTLLSWTPDMEAMIASGGRISTMDGTADEIRAKSLAAGKEKNEKLIGKVLSSGHTSVLEHGYVNLAFENVSVLAEQFLIEFRLASFTVKSRRYVDFSGAGYVAPELPSPQAQALAEELSQKYGVACLCINCLTLDDADITEIMQGVLQEFPITELGIFLPSWVDALPMEHEIKRGLFDAIADASKDMKRIRDVYAVLDRLDCVEIVSQTRVRDMAMGTGRVLAELELPRQLYYQTISGQSGFPIRDDGDLMALLTELREVKTEYDRIREALDDVRTKGYGIVMPTPEEMHLEEPEIVHQGGRYGVRLKASAPSIHMIMANIETEVSPALGGEKASEEIVNFLLQGFEGDVNRIWESNIFGKSLYDIAGEGLTNKIRKMPEGAQGKLQETLQRIINEGSGGLICIIL